MIARDHGLSTRYSVTSLKASAATAAVPTCVAPPMTDGRRPTPTDAAPKPSVGSQLLAELVADALGWTTGFFGVGLLGTLRLGPPGWTRGVVRGTVGFRIVGLKPFVGNFGGMVFFWL